MENKKDYTSYPQGFKNLAKILDLPQKDEAAREAFLWGVIDSLIKN